MIVNIHEAKTHLSRLVDRAAAGEEIVIGKSGRPLAKLVPFTQRREPRQPGRWGGRVEVAGDFDQTPDWIVAAFEAT